MAAHELQVGLFWLTFLDSLIFCYLWFSVNIYRVEKVQNFIHEIPVNRTSVRVDCLSS